MEKLIYIKTIDGNYVIGKIKQENPLIIEKPIAINFEPMMGGLSFVPYDAFYLGKELEEIEFKDEHIMHKFFNDDIPMEIEQKYREYLSGIITPSNPELNQNLDNFASKLGIK